MPQLIVAAVAAAASWGTAGALTGAVIGGITISSTVAGIIGAGVGLLVSIAGGMLLSSAAKKPTLPDFAQDRKQAVRSGIEPMRVVYGRTMVTGPVVYMGSSGTDNEYLHLVVPVAGHAIDGFESVWINNKEIALAAPGVGGLDALDRAGGALAGTIRIHTYDGTQTTASAALISECPGDWTSDHKLLGCAYIYVRVQYAYEQIESFNSISAVVRGKKVYDPRDETTAWSANAALCILDYLLSENGINADIDSEVELSFFEAAANICDETVALVSGGSVTEPRYELHGSFQLSDSQTRLDTMEALLSACGGALTYVSGAYRLHVAAYETPTVSLTEADLAGDIIIQPKPPRRSMINQVLGTYIAPDQKWEAVSMPPVTVSAFETEDGEAVPQNAEYLYVTSRTQAQRLGRIALLRARNGLTAEIPLKLTGHQITAWSMISLSVADLDWTDKAFRVVSWSFDPVGKLIRVRVQEEYSTSYSWVYSDAGPDLSTDDPTLVRPLDIAAPTGLTVTPTTVLQGDGSTVPALDVTWEAAPNPFATATEVQWRKDGDTAWSSIEVPAPATRAIIQPLVSGVDYDVRVRARAAFLPSAFTSTTTETVAADTTAPGVPSSLAAAAISAGISLTWTNPTEPDLVAVEVWENTSSSTTGRYFVGETSGAYYLRTGLGGAVTRYFWVRSRDRSGNLSAYAGPVNATSTEIGRTDIAAWATSGHKYVASNTTEEINRYDMTVVSTATIVVPDGAGVTIMFRADIDAVALPGGSGDGSTGDGGESDAGAE